MNDSPQDSDPATPVRGANFWVRAVAHAIDFSILLLLTCLIVIPLSIRIILESAATDPAAAALGYPIWVDIVFQVVIAAVVITLWRKTQTTPGKALFRLRIVALDDGGRPSLPKLVIRFLGYLVAMVPIPAPLLTKAFPSLRELPYIGGVMDDWRLMPPLMLGFFWILIDRRNRGWHDLMSGTVTVPKPEPLQTPSPLTPSPQPEPHADSPA